MTLCRHRLYIVDAEDLSRPSRGIFREADVCIVFKCYLLEPLD